MALAKDPVCGMEVDTDTDLNFEYEGETYYFCSRGCKLDFEEDPEKYLDPTYEPSM
jgi:P-type Cu+ transporter